MLGSIVLLSDGWNARGDARPMRRALVVAYYPRFEGWQVAWYRVRYCDTGEWVMVSTGVIERAPLEV